MTKLLLSLFLLYLSSCGGGQGSNEKSNQLKISEEQVQTLTKKGVNLNSLSAQGVKITGELKKEEAKKVEVIANCSVQSMLGEDCDDKEISAEFTAEEKSEFWEDVKCIIGSLFEEEEDDNCLKRASDIRDCVVKSIFRQPC